MRKSAPIEVVVHYPKTEEGWEELGKRVATAHANYVIEKIERLNCPTWQKLELYQAVIDTTKGTYKPKAVKCAQYDGDKSPSLLQSGDEMLLVFNEKGTYKVSAGTLQRIVFVS